jgi:hypothetical protein
MYTSSTYHL